MSSSSSALPPDLRVLCRKLTSTPPAQLPHLLPSLVNHILRCRAPLSSAQDQKLKDGAPESAQLVHKLKISINTLLDGRSREGRFAAIGLIKAVIDVGGWEILNGSERWVRGLLSIVQKSDPVASKELAVVTLTRMFMLLHPYQTLVREIVTPNLPAFITACLQLIKPPSADQASTTPLAFVETICDALSTLIPLYSTTCRPFSSKIKDAVRIYLVPTESDETCTPESLQHSARRLVVSLHHVAAKSAGSDEWAKLVDGILKNFHSTADQVLRAVDESWESADGQSRPTVDFDGEPYGGGFSSEELPRWTGLNAGAQRLVGLFHYLSDCLQCPTKAAVTVPTGGLMDAVSRLCLIARLSPKSQTWDQAIEINDAIGREERDELWSLMPEIHVAAIQLVRDILHRLEQDALPLVPEILDHLVRVFRSAMDNSTVRMTGYKALNDILSVSGPTLSKPSVDILDPLIRACCRDLQQDAGVLKQADKVSKSTDTKKNGVAQNADLFLLSQDSALDTPPSLGLDHKAAATALLTAILSALPQQHLKPGLRGLLERTAILIRDRDAMLASVLHPYKDPSGRIHQSILPHLSQQFPEDQGLEILRTNMRTDALRNQDDDVHPDDLVDDDEEEDEDIEEDVGEENQPATETTQDPWKTRALPAAQTEVDLPIQSNPFDSNETAAPTTYGAFGHIKPEAESPPKRKHEGSDPIPAKRQELETASSAEPSRAPVVQSNADEDEDDDSDESVHLNMELDDIDEDDQEDE